MAETQIIDEEALRPRRRLREVQRIYLPPES
jgi:hypothetical protein